jgi:hypothetical protein
MTEAWERFAFGSAYDFQDSLAALMESRHNAYRDDALVVIDLARPAGGPMTSQVRP